MFFANCFNLLMYNWLLNRTHTSKITLAQKMIESKTWFETTQINSRIDSVLFLIQISLTVPSMNKTSIQLKAPVHPRGTGPFLISAILTPLSFWSGPSSTI